jgi:hypothetical protein
MPSGLDCALFSLTPALSLGEREDCFPRRDKSSRVESADGRARILPLPKGEGRGEGEEDIRQPSGSPREISCPGRISKPGSAAISRGKYPPVSTKVGYGVEPFMVSSLRLAGSS